MVNGFKNIEGQLARWIEELAVYNMKIVHRPGKDHVNADNPSRISDPLVQGNYDEVDDIVPLAVRHISQDESDIEQHEDATWVGKYTAQDLRKMQLQDDTTAQIIRWLITNRVSQN